jgi:hypothetical protein
MRPPISPSSSRRLSLLAVRTAGVVLLTPLIVLAGLLAVVGLTAVMLSRRTGPARRRSTSALRSPLRLEPSSAEASLGALDQRAA